MYNTFTNLKKYKTNYKKEIQKINKNENLCNTL